ncbi:uncharacterized protein LOC107797378 [Nicotiana tabacum]|uniref:J domain-containing protein n=3 Tax=Nicotiana tabacum TaxID=4097 RepID=A0A1S4AGK1_TOBAC|nr:PREDICTED: uncharacterized protein LOC107797378 [Nicotiana tabacum]XP_016475747.1 PREDICTED: uncharacterized protein LOC107797378 [Nicotiana tabacum]XP_016475748.1 PREDICTED: uncharacterized protein LOC107797378 [Nicotiana tabacum]XP_016475749.1 PREDICTED: uncharacterized protein LOC107797378 [Nicotiana tabacum]XP_016475750.1 PREDICTED: uncharacterized protein LOC107797378 [Nicotiana tabacum]
MADDTEKPKSDAGAESESEHEPEAKALRLKTLAEQKYNSGNLKLALKYARRAHRLNPNLDGVSEMLTSFKILRTSTINTVNTSILPDYYKILQIERFSHINTIKIQYKKLALTLHPDKNPYVASEEAFKLVNEAFRVLSDKSRRKEYDVKLRVSMQSDLMAEEGSETGETTTFWTACSGCRLLHQFDRKYLGHNLMCPSCKKSFEAIEVEENSENLGVSEGTRVSARIKARKSVNLGFSRNGELGVKGKMGNVGEVLKRPRGKMMRSVDENGVGDKGVRAKRAAKVRDVDTEGDIESDDCLIEGLRSRTKGKVRIGDGTEVVGAKRTVKVRNVDMEGDVESDDGLIKELRSRSKSKVRNVGEGEEETMTLAEMQMLVKKKVNKEKVEVGEKRKEKAEIDKAVNFNLTEKVSEERKETDLSFKDEEDEVEMERLIARVREKRVRRESLKGDGLEHGGKGRDLDRKRGGKGSRQDDLEIVAENEKEENEKAMEFNLTEKESEKRKETGLSLIEDEDEVEMEKLIARVREKRVRRESLKGDGLEDGGRRDLSSKRGGKGSRQDAEIMAENEKAMKFNLIEKESEKRKETDLSLIEEEDEVEMENLIARVREKRVRHESLKADSLEDGGRRRVSSRKKGKGSRHEETEQNKKGMKFNLAEMESEKTKETDLSLIEKEDELEMETPIARVREKRVKHDLLKGDGSEDGGRRRVSSSKRGKGSWQDVLETMAVETFDLYNFDKDRVERSFKKGQVWAVYDDDGMPRDYALIDDVISVHPFEVKLSRLEFQSNSDEALLHWGKMGFHISCGKFKVSTHALVKSLKKFSHVVDCERAARELYRIYPSKGSIWALYKENALGAGSRTLMVEDKQSYDIVVSLSSYTDLHGVSIAYLEKVDGFRTLFKRREIGAHAVKLLGKNELGLFSHRIPARKLSDEEASNISKHCWEVDPASLPHKFLAIWGS